MGCGDSHSVKPRQSADFSPFPSASLLCPVYFEEFISGNLVPLVFQFIILVYVDPVPKEIKIFVDHLLMERSLHSIVLHLIGHLKDLRMTFQ